MKVKILITVCFCLSLHIGFSQIVKKDSTVLSPEQSMEILKMIKPDSAKLLNENALAACKCIDSTLQGRTAGDPDPNTGINSCIEKVTETYQMLMKIYSSLFSSNKKIIINTDHNSADFKSYYSDIESWLMDSCSALKLLLGSDDTEGSEFSYSKDPDALDQYNKGINYFNKEDYNTALPYFKKAVEIDARFVFAMDNLAICYRRAGSFDKALATYEKSLKIYPRGKIPLQNIPVIYILQKEYAKAEKSYKKMLQYFPDDAESFYGLGRLQIFYTDDMTKGLDNMCKAYNIYIKMNSAYRVDAEKNMAYVFKKMKADGKEDEFHKILKANNIVIGKD